MCSSDLGIVLVATAVLAVTLEADLVVVIATMRRQRRIDSRLRDDPLTRIEHHDTDLFVPGERLDHALHEFIAAAAVGKLARKARHEPIQLDRIAMAHKLIDARPAITQHRDQEESAAARPL